MRVLKFILQLIRPYRLYVWGIFLATVLITLDNALKPFLVKQLIDTVAQHSQHNLWLVCLAYAFLQFMLVGAWSFSDYCLVRYTAPLRSDIIEHFIQRLFHFPYTFFQDQLTGSITTKVNDVATLLPSLIFTTINQFGYLILLVLFAVGLLASVSPIFALTLIAWISLFVGRSCWFIKKNMMLTKDHAEEKSKIVGGVADYINNIFSVKIFATYAAELARFNRLKTGFLHTAWQQGSYSMKFYWWQGVITSIYIIGSVICLIVNAKRSLITSGDFALVIMINFNIISNIYMISNTLREFLTNWGSVDQALALLETVVPLEDLPSAPDLTVTQGEITFQGVQFHYSGMAPLFHNKSITLQAGQKVGLVGYSGGGKSTFVHLILRLYELTEGCILVDGQDIKTVTQDSLRRYIAMIPQDPLLFHRSLHENIRYGRAEASDSAVVEAAKQAHAHEFITQLPHGYDSLVGERGVKLSGGQRQRIAIARAILKDAPILIFDEATSQLDSLTESALQETLWELMQGRTTIVIAHRLSTLLKMDRILVFAHGKIIEDGTHATLLAQGGLYQTLWDAQVGGFLPERGSF